MVYIAHVEPFATKYLNRLEMSNEFIILCLCYFMFMNSDGLMMMPNPGYPEYDESIKDMATKNLMGWVNIALIGLLVFNNLMVMLTVQAHMIYSKVRVCCLKRSHKKKMNAFRKSQRKAKREFYSKYMCGDYLPAEEPEMIRQAIRYNMYLPNMHSPYMQLRYGPRRELTEDEQLQLQILSAERRAVATSKRFGAEWRAEYERRSRPDPDTT